tara:strand:+ start:864 stop:1160 length:297 start_codon:yes stop_codon:yes gene_type:complete
MVYNKYIRTKKVIDMPRNNPFFKFMLMIFSGFMMLVIAFPAYSFRGAREGRDRSVNINARESINANRNNIETRGDASREQAYLYNHNGKRYRYLHNGK